MRNQVFKKLFSVLLALIMVAGLLPASVLAEGWTAADVATTPAPTETEQPAEPTPGQGEPVAEPTPEQGEPTAEPVPTQGEPTAEPTDEGIMPANVMPVQANVAARDTSGDDYYRIVHLDCGRKYFDVNYIKGIIDTMYLNGYNQLQLAFGNGGLRFVLDGMSQDLKDAIAQGNKKFHDSTTNELTQAEMTEIILYAKGKNIEIVPLLNMPGHMDGILLSDKYSGYKLSGSEGSLDLNNENAVAFGKELLSMYVEYFKTQGCKFFNFGADEYGQGIRNPYIESSVAKVDYNQLINYMNACAEIIENAGMTARCFNDFVCYNNRTSCDLKKSVQVCYWSNQWSGSEYNTVDVINNAGYKLINTNQKWYFVPSKANEYSKATVLANFKTFDVTKFQHITSGYNSTSTTYYEISGGNNVGAMFCVWCDTPSVAVDLSDVKELIAAMADANPTCFTKVTIPPTTVGNATTAENDTVRVTGPNLATLKCDTATVEIQGAAEGKIAAYNVTPSTADSTYTEKAEVRIKIPEGWDSSKVIAFIVEDGAVKDIDGTATEDGWYVFTAPHFSVMGIYEKAATTEVGGTIEIVAGQTKTITVEGDVTVGDIANDTVATKEKVEKVQQTGETIDYNATASASLDAYQRNYVSNLIDGKESTYYWSSKPQALGAYAQVDLGAAIPFDAVRIIPPTNNSDDAKCTADVEVSADGSSWTTIGSYDGTKTTVLSNTAGNVRYIKVKITEASVFWWQLAEIQWGKYENGTFTSMAASGSVTTESKTETQVTIKGIKAGETTTIVIDGKTYTIKVVDATLAEEKIDVELWITDGGVVPTGWDSNPPVGFVYQDCLTLGNWTGKAYITVNAGQYGFNSEDGVVLHEAILGNVLTGTTTYGNNTEGTKECNVEYWKTAYHTKDNRQEITGWTNNSHLGIEFKYLRYWENSWAYSADRVNWVEISDISATDNTKNQISIFYREPTTITDEVSTKVVDWGPTEYGQYQSLLDFAVKYESLDVRVPDTFPQAGKTIGFNRYEGNDNPQYKGTDSKGYAYRIVYGIAGVETADYEVYMITATNYKDSHTSSDRLTYSSVPTSYTYSGEEVVVWAKETTDATNSGLTVSDNLKTAADTDGEPYLESVNIYEYQALLITYYLRAKGGLKVHYIARNNGSEDEFYSYNIAVEKNTTFGEIAQSGPTIVADTVTLNGESYDYIKNGKVKNIKGKYEYVTHVLTLIPEIKAQYRYTDFTCVEIRLSEDGKEAFLYYEFNNAKTYVVDFGIPLKIKLTDLNSELANATINSVKITGQTHGTAVYNESEKAIIYTLTKVLSERERLSIDVTGSRDNNTDSVTYNVTIIPATNVYYEDSFAKFTNGKGAADKAKWSIDTNKDGETLTEQQQKDSYTEQALEALGEKTNVYGYDPAYNNCTMFSMGSARKVTVTSTMAEKTNWDSYADSAWPTAQFTFKGTGFDIISLTDNTSGAIFVDVINTKTGEKAKSVFVDNYYGYTYNSETNTWDATPEKANALYQIPVIALRNLPYAEYNVVIKVAYSEYFDHTADPQGSYSFWLDAVRVYNPMGESKDTGDTYKDDNESFPQYIKLRDELAKTENTTVKFKMVFIDGGNTADIATYANIGPNNEVYLANGQAITFKLAGDLTNIATVQIGAKSPNSNETNKASMVIGSITKELNTATEMYYAITDAAKNGNAITITNNGNAILSLTNLKITFASKPETEVTLAKLSEAEQQDAVATVRALFAPAPVEPEPEPEPKKTFEPKRFEASWSRNVMQGRKATLTVKTSEDVEAITVDGQTIRSYRTRTERVGFGRRAKRITYREFTYSMVAQESADFSVTAINAEGTESEAITARLTVKTRPNSMRDMWDWFKGWF